MAVQNIISLVLISLLICIPRHVEAALQPVNFGSFIRSATFSVAEEMGFFTENNLNVSYLQIPNSTFAYANLLSGGYDILNGQIDNDVNLRFNFNESITVLGQTDGGSDLVLASINSITSVFDLKGKSIMVDSPVSGYSYILQKILSLYGLTVANGDFTLQTVGGTPLRYAALTSGSLPNGSTAFATILTYPFTAMGQELATNPVNILARISDFVSPYSSRELAIPSSTLNSTTKLPLITTFYKSFYEANLFLQNTFNKPCVITSLMTNLKISMTTAENEYLAATNNLTGETMPELDDFSVSPQGILNIIDLRNQFGGFPNLSTGFDFVDALVPGPNNLVDYSVQSTVLQMVEANGSNITCPSATNTASAAATGSASTTAATSDGGKVDVGLFVVLGVGVFVAFLI